MNMSTLRIVSSALLCLAVTFAIRAEEAEDKPKGLGDGLSQGKVQVDLRYRFETIDQASFTSDANASTLRTALSYRTRPWNGWSLFLEAENIAAVPDDDGYNNAGRGDDWNRVSDRPVVADPALTEMNQAYLRWSGERLETTFGRQEINIGDQRFVGAVGWRQNHQSFDAARVQWRATERVDIDYAFITDVHRIFGDSAESSHHLLTVPLRWGSDRLGGEVTAYGYLLDYDVSSGLSTLSSQTLGIEWRGRANRWSWELEAAQQDDAGDNPAPLDAGYLHGTVGVEWSFGEVEVTTDLDWERLDGGADGRFQTPLATLHKFNGWADIFLSTPGFGVETTTLRLKGKHGVVSWILAWLDHKAESRDLDYGTEIDGQLSWKASWGQALTLKFALYERDRAGFDTDKIMFFTTYRFGG